MMLGTVTRLQATLPVLFRLPDRRDIVLEFVVDTGFSGFLTLPPAAVAAMGLDYLEEVPATLADDSAVTLRAHSATIIWHDREQKVSVFATGARTLVGTALLAGSELSVQFIEDGAVTIDQL